MSMNFFFIYVLKFDFTEHNLFITFQIRFTEKIWFALSALNVDTTSAPALS